VCHSNEDWGSAVCVYSLASINLVFDSGAWVEQTRLESAWLRVNEYDVPTPRPGQVYHYCMLASARVIDRAEHEITLSPVHTADADATQTVGLSRVGGVKAPVGSRE